MVTHRGLGGPAHTPSGSAGVLAPLDAAPGGARFPLGAPVLDARLGGGLGRGAVHEVLAATSGDGAAAAGLALGLAARAAEGRPVLWVRQSLLDHRTGRPHGAGVGEMGLDPGAVLFVRAKDAAAALRAAHEGARCAGLGAVLLDLWGQPRALDLAAGKRLSLAAGRSGVTVILLRVQAEPRPGPAWTRWTVAAAPSRALGANAPGRPAWRARLVRHRGGVGEAEWRLEWDRERGRFELGGSDGAEGGAEAARGAAPLGAVAAVPAGRARAARGGAG